VEHMSAVLPKEALVMVYMVFLSFSDIIWQLIYVSELCLLVYLFD
jgi:hypothetical protein